MVNWLAYLGCCINFMGSGKSKDLEILTLSCTLKLKRLCGRCWIKTRGSKMRSCKMHMKQVTMVPRVWPNVLIKSHLVRWCREIEASQNDWSLCSSNQSSGTFACIAIKTTGSKMRSWKMHMKQSTLVPRVWPNVLIKSHWVRWCRGIGASQNDWCLCSSNQSSGICFSRTHFQKGK